MINQLNSHHLSMKKRFPSLIYSLCAFKFNLIKAALPCLFCLIFSFATANAQVTPPFLLPKAQDLNKIHSAIIFTNKGNIHIELYPHEAPWHVANFKYLADKGFYKNTKFHLYYPDYIIQGGDPNGDGTGGPGYSLPPEFNSHKHEEGSLGMARLSNSKNPERRSNGSQFHILMRENPKMDGDYTVFGKVTKGMSVVQQLRKGDVIEDLIVFIKE